MVFSSVEFIFFFLPMVVLIYWILLKIGKNNVKYPNVFLTIASLFFYACGEPVYILLMILSIVINYVFGRVIDRQIGMRKKIIFVIDISINLIILVFFKYLGFLIENINTLFDLSWSAVQVILPIGISFYTFQIITYIVDVYRGETEAQKNIVDLALYISFFPQLIAGPIVEYSMIYYQISSRIHSKAMIEKGICSFVTGLTKKVVFSNNLGYLADQIMNGSLECCGIVSGWLGIICYTLQIYFDFSGYSDMAIGLGKVFGFDLPKNFNYPYTATSIRDFWRRWHITLSGFFKNYVYIPLGGNRCWVYRNLGIVFFLTGLWHGASWNFVIWGLWHGLFSILERVIGKKMEKIPVWIRRIYTMFIVIVGWVFFRMENLPDAIEYFKILFGIKNTTVLFDLQYYLDNFTILIIILGCICCLPIFDKLRKRYEDTGVYKLFIVILLVISCMFLQASSYNPFIYFQF